MNESDKITKMTVVVPEGWEAAHCLDPLRKGCSKSWPRPRGASTACTCGAFIPALAKPIPTPLATGEGRAYIITDSQGQAVAEGD